MIATLISKGQITVPREIRDLLGLAAGSMLDFQVPPGSLLISDVQQDDAAQLLAVRSLLEAPAIAFEARETISAAPTRFWQACCGFVGCLIATKHARLGCSSHSHL